MRKHVDKGLATKLRNINPLMGVEEQTLCRPRNRRNPAPPSSARKQQPSERRNPPRKQWRQWRRSRKIPGRKSATVLTMLEQGATIQELMSATGWQAHSVRGFLSRTVRKQLGRTVTPHHPGKRNQSLPTQPPIDAFQPTPEHRLTVSWCSGLTSSGVVSSATLGVRNSCMVRVPCRLPLDG